jgi:hypothetical protein
MYGSKQKEITAERERERERESKIKEKTIRRQEEIGRGREKGVEKVNGEIMEGVRESNRRQEEINRVMKQWEEESKGMGKFERDREETERKRKEG